MYRFLDAISPDDVEAIAGLAYAEMLEAGFTTVGEFHYLHHQPDGSAYADIGEMAGRHVAAAAETGIGIALLPVFYRHGGMGGQPALPGQRRFLTDLDRFGNLAGAAAAHAGRYLRGSFGIAPHSLRAATPQEIAVLAHTFPDVPIHIHVSEQTAEVEACLAVHQRRPVQLLADTVELGGRWCLIHATHADAGERALMAASGAIAGLCPITEANLGDGLFGAVDYLAANGAFGIGTDSNVAISVAAELRQIEYSQRLHHRARNVLARAEQSTARRLFDGALAGGHQALQLGPAGFQVGARGDAVVLDTRAMALAGREGDQILDSFVFAGADRTIDRVYVCGECLVENGRHRYKGAIEAKARAVLQRLVA